MKDFTLKMYRELLRAILARDFIFQTFDAFMTKPRADRCIVLRHDVDLRPGNALKTALIENGLGITASYYFRAVPESWDESIIREIADLGHEIGYHYENLSACRGDADKGWADFKSNLAKLRVVAPVTTICMHGSPMSKWDNRDLWKKYNYRDLGIIAEPYFDVDFDEVFYLTDTGRRWDGDKVSVRDRVRSSNRDSKLNFRSTKDIIRAVEDGNLPVKLMITTHPQRWDDRWGPWLKEQVWQNVKNIGKRLIVRNP